MTLRPRLAHESGDGITVAHCPFCGSGQVIGRSDGNTECQFCNRAFLVRVQPEFSAFPQSVGGVPVQIPGMPPPGPAMGMDPMAEDGAPPGAGPEDGEQDAAGGGFPPGAEDGGSDDEDDEGGDEDKGGPPFAKKESFRTAAGTALGRGAYVAHLARLLETP